MKRTKEQLAEAIAEAIRHEEGFYVTEAAIKSGAVKGAFRQDTGKWQTIAQWLNNPGNLRRWRRNGKPLPTVQTLSGTFVRFETLEDGCRTHRSLVTQYIEGKYHGGKVPTLREFFATYAPKGDGKNDPLRYAEKVAARIGVTDIDAPLSELIQ